ncbi:MAG: hypothetical protein HZC40_09020 [Chloroflexi bacterium]|nr:hypothetical protein [Chloroflexota bacterium]
MISWLNKEYGITTVIGHNEVPGNRDNVCPGRNLTPFIPYLNKFLTPW